MLFSKVGMWYTWMKPNRLKNKSLKSHCKYIKSPFPQWRFVADWTRIGLGMKWDSLYALKCLKIIKPHKRWSAATMLKSPFENDVPTFYMYLYHYLYSVQALGLYTIFHLVTQFEENILLVKLRGYHDGIFKFQNKIRINLKRIENILMFLYTK